MTDTTAISPEIQAILNEPICSYLESESEVQELSLAFGREADDIRKITLGSVVEDIRTVMVQGRRVSDLPNFLPKVFEMAAQRHGAEKIQPVITVVSDELDALIDETKTLHTEIIRQIEEKDPTPLGELYPRRTLQ